MTDPRIIKLNPDAGPDDFLKDATTIDVLCLVLATIVYIGSIDPMATAVIERAAEHYAERLGGTMYEVEPADAPDAPTA